MILINTVKPFNLRLDHISVLLGDITLFMLPIGNKIEKRLMVDLPCCTAAGHIISAITPTHSC